MKPATQKKLTKRQLKALRGPNAAVKMSLKNGVEITMRDGTTYCGRNPEYRLDPITGMHVKARSGIPFVRATPKQ